MNECRTISRIGTNRKISTRVVHTASAQCTPSRLRTFGWTGLLCARYSRWATSASARFCRHESTKGRANTSALRASQMMPAKTTSDSSTMPIISTAIAEPCGQFCEPRNWLSMSEPTMKPSAPPSTVAVM